MGERSQISGLRRNGEEFPAEASIARVSVENRVVYTVVLRDVTARQRTEQELRAAIVPEVAEQVAVIRRAAEQMDALIEDLADVTRIESGRLVVHPTAIDPVTLMELACHTLRPLAEAKGQALHVEFPDALPAIMADPDRARQVSSNVIGNALTFSLAGTTVRVTASTQEDKPR